VPFGVKELEQCAGLRHTRGSLLYRDISPSDRDSFQVARLRGAGAIPVGTTAASEFGMDSVTSTRLWGTTRNPWDLDLTPGGSSGGSAAAVCARLVPFATGSDAGGSIRQPAAFCGLTGFKPTYGLVPRRETDTSAVDTAGVLTTTVLETARVLDVTAGEHPFDRSSLRAPVPGFEAACHAAELPSLSLCWSDLGYIAEREVVRVAHEAAQRLAEALGVELEERQVTLPTPFPIWVAPVALELRSRLEAEDVWPARIDELCEMTRELVAMAPDPTPARLFEAAERRAEFERRVAEAFTDVDIMLTPTNCTQPFAAAGPWPSEVDGQDVEEQTTDAYEMLANLTGRPALSVPAGLSDQGLPVGLQLMGRRQDDRNVLALGHLYEKHS
jgi:Asp-tRNA(Asn)/Glu-tRNA(Gln) amidotransferase A subunit family amidase